VLVATPTPAPPTRRLSDLQRSAFWIYGVTAMVMREPFGILIRHTTDVGLGNWQVRLEWLRVFVILLLLARLFLIAGLYFETVYMQGDSAEQYPRRSYPIDFLAGLAQFLVAAATTTAIGTHALIARQIAPFTLVTAVFLLIDVGWVMVAAFRRFSSVSLLRADASRNLWILAAGLAVWSVSRIAGADAVLADQLALLAILTGGVLDVARQVKTYEKLDR
jgi:hypothetical protein